MRSLSMRPLIIGSALVFIVLNTFLASASDTGGRKKGCAKHCLSGCKTRGPGKCDRRCKPSYSLQQWSGLCIPKCGIGCQKCIRVKWTSYRHCRKCLPGYKLRIKKRTGDTYCEEEPLVCDPNCVSGCKIKKNSRCDSLCKSNYILTNRFMCGACDENCVDTSPGNCTYPGTCRSCKDGYTADTVTQQCATCSTGCTGSCATKGPGFCDGDTCSSNYDYDATLGVCQPCDPHCISGCATNGPGTCDGECESGYGPTGTHKCATCDANCQSGCSTKGAGRCDSACKPGWFLNGGTGGTYACEQCQPPPACNATVVCPYVGQCTSDGCGTGYKYDSGLLACV